MDDWLEKLIAHEAAYFQFAAKLEKTPTAWYLTNSEKPDYRDTNHALRLRDDGRGSEAVAQEIIAYFRSRGLSPTADIDEIAESQGIGAALRRRGVTPLIGNILLMRYAPPAGFIPPETPESSPVFVRVVPNETGQGESNQWIDTVVQGSEPYWAGGVEREARFPACRLYLALFDGKPAAACDLFESDGWARLDSVGTRPEDRRRGVASMLVARVLADVLASENKVFYLFTEAGGDGERLYRKLGFIPWKLNGFRRHHCE